MRIDLKKRNLLRNRKAASSRYCLLDNSDKRCWINSVGESNSVLKKIEIHQIQIELVLSL